MRRAAFIFLLTLIFTGCHKNPSDIKLPSVIGDNMLLQQKTDANIFGKAHPGQEIQISASWGEKGKAIAGMDGKWSAPLSTPEAGGPYSLTITAWDTTITVKNILVGDVWVCSGQSNMEMPVAGWPPADTIEHSAAAIAGAGNPDIRLFMVTRKVSTDPLDDCTGKWMVCDPSTVQQFSAVGYFFGRKLNKELKIPIGLIESAWGGTPVEAWISSASLTGAGEFKKEISDMAGMSPKMDEYLKWLEGHKQVEITQNGEDQWKNLNFDDEKVPSSDYDDSKWPVMDLPRNFETRIGDFDGAIWFRKSIEIPERMAGKDLILSLGPIDDMDRTYFNGELVGAEEVSGVWQVDRLYDVPAKLVKPGENIIAVRVIDTQGGGGLFGKPSQLNISLKTDKAVSLSLAGDWKYQPVAEFIGNRFYLFNLANNDFTDKERPRQIGPSSPSVLYNGMINPIIPYKIKGAIWYQGEANVGRADQYAKIFPLMIKNWRKAWDEKEFPFYFVQIAPYVYSNPDSTESAFLREAQEQALKLPNTGMVVTLDIATVNNIHPPFKIEVGERLAALALNNEYGIKMDISGPVYKSMSKDGKSIKIQFDNIADGLVAKGGRLTEFEIAGKNGKYVKADAKIVDNMIVVSAPSVADPFSVRYCWHNGSTASLFNSEGLPALQFRTKK
jgi:sialate O-acetylesterase